MIGRWARTHAHLWSYTDCGIFTCDVCRICTPDVKWQNMQQIAQVGVVYFSWNVPCVLLQTFCELFKFPVTTWDGHLTVDNSSCTCADEFASWSDDRCWWNATNDSDCDRRQQQWMTDEKTVLKEIVFCVWSCCFDISAPSTRATVSNDHSNLF